MEIKVSKIEESKLGNVDFDNLQFGRTFSDHMFVADFENGEWKNFQIKPYSSFSISPASATLHYGQTIFEGLKAYRNKDAEIMLFRPEYNCQRLNNSAIRMCMAEIPEEIFMEGLRQLLKIDQEWVPRKAGSTLYIRPFMFADEEFLGVKPSSKYKFVIITSPASTYYTGAVKVKVEKKYVRAAEGGVGMAKNGGNYAASLYPAKLAQDQGFHQLVWTDSKTHEFIEEAGTMNIMAVVNDTLLTPSIEKLTVLKGKTRDTVLALAKSWGMKIEERPIRVDEIKEAHKNGTLQEVFGVGTAATVAPIALISIDEVNYEIPHLQEGSFSKKVAQYLSDLRLGNIEDKFNWMQKAF
jgi:branched-chain amino acid aminotransferase